MSQGQCYVKIHEQKYFHGGIKRQGTIHSNELAIKESKAKISDPPFLHTVTLHFKNGCSRGEHITTYFTKWI